MFLKQENETNLDIKLFFRVAYVLLTKVSKVLKGYTLKSEEYK